MSTSNKLARKSLGTLVECTENQDASNPPLQVNAAACSDAICESADVVEKPTQTDKRHEREGSCGNAGPTSSNADKLSLRFSKETEDFQDQKQTRKVKTFTANDD
jgi:hypothetical protein